MLSKIDNWNDSIIHISSLNSYIKEIEQKYGKVILLEDMSNYPKPNIVADFLGTYREEDQNIIVYLDVEKINLISQTDHIDIKERKTFLNQNNLSKRELIFGHVINHELIHYEMDKEGYPVTKNTDAYKDNDNIIQIGSIVQRAVLHGEVEKRQDNRRLPVIYRSKNRFNLFMEDIQRKGIIVSIDKVRKIKDVLENNEDLTPQNALEAIKKIINILNLEDKLEASCILERMKR